MVKNKKKKNSLLFMMILILTSINMFILTNFSNLSSSSNNIIRIDDDVELESNPINTPKSSMMGTHSWWDPNWPYRILINVTNQESVDLKNYGVSVVFPYGTTYSGKVNNTLKDIRIIENENGNNYERNFFIFQDFPNPNEATIYFNTNISASATETDTYIYFGNMGVETTAVQNGLGLVKNGDFEYIPLGEDPIGTPEISKYSYDPVGWNWSHNVPDNIIPWGDVTGDDTTYQGVSDPSSNWQNCLVDASKAQNQVQLRGTYSYKWGTNRTLVPEDKGNIPIPGNDDYNGVLYSNPFVVPIVGDGNPSVDKIYLHLWRNIRACSFEYKTNNDNIDGYFLRIINASAGISDIDNEIMLGNYLELFIGTGSNSLGDTLRNFTSGTEGNTISTFAGDISGEIVFDLSNYMGENISLEIGMIGDEGDINEDIAFGQIDQVYFTYQVDTELNDYQEQTTNIKVITRDIDGNIVPNAEVSLVQNNAPKTTQTTDDTGEYEFTSQSFGIYNFTVNYTFAPGVEQVVFNSTEANFGTSLYNIYNATDVSETYVLYLDIWTINFEIVDWDDEPLDDGYIKVYNQEGGNLLKTIQLVNGSAEFRCRNDIKYFYEVYFDNSNYVINDILLNKSNIYRSDYEATSRNLHHTFIVNETNIGSGSFYKVSERIYTNGSTKDFSIKKLIKANITLSNMADQIDNLTIYYIDEDNKTINNKIYENLTYSGEQSDFISLDIRLADNDKLKNEKFDAYGLLIIVEGQNSTTCNGIINIDTVEKCHINNKTALSKMHIRIVNIVDFIHYPVYPVSVIITNSTNSVTTLTTYDDGWASHDSDIYKPFIYLIGSQYNISLKRFGEDKLFKVNYTAPSQWMPNVTVGEMNITLNENSTIFLYIDMSGAPVDPETQIEEISSTTFVTWGENVTIIVNASYSPDGDPPWTLLTDPGTLQCSVKSWTTGDTFLTEQMAPAAGNDNYSITIDSSRLLAGDDFEEYWFIISGTFSGYQDPESLYVEGKILTKITTLNLVDYNTHQVISEISKEYNEIVNVTVHYFNSSSIPLLDATITFDWLALPLKTLNVDPLNDSYYYITINTSEAAQGDDEKGIGDKVVTIEASLDNYTSQTLIFNIDVLERPTTLNGDNGTLYINKRIWVEDPYNFSLTYEDVLSEKNITGEFDTLTYTWFELDENREIITGKEGMGTLIQNLDDTLTLDFDTEIRPIGYYQLIISIHKVNYEVKNALIYIEIKLRELEFDLEATNLDGSQISIVQGNDVNFEINLVDTTRNIPLTNAVVKLEIRDKEYILEEQSQGVYKLTFKTEDIDAFFATQTFTGKIIIEKDNFTSQEFSITINVLMEEIFSGMPSFYFFLLIFSIVGIVGSLVSYRVIQQARIPKFIKKIRKVKNSIKSNKPITESLSIPTKEKMIFDLFGNEWEEIGLSLGDVLGIDKLKSNNLKIKDQNFKKGGESF